MQGEGSEAKVTGAEGVLSEGVGWAAGVERAAGVQDAAAPLSVGAGGCCEWTGHHDGTCREARCDAEREGTKHVLTRGQGEGPKSEGTGGTGTV